MNNQDAIEHLTVEDRTIVLSCMRATAAHLDDAEAHTRLGITPTGLARLIADWPNVGNDENAILALNNSLNEVCHGFKIEPGDWPKWFDVPIEQVRQTYLKWLSLTGLQGGIR